MAKKCKVCKKVFNDVSNSFYKDRAKPDGFEYECKTCSKKARAGRYQDKKKRTGSGR